MASAAVLFATWWWQGDRGVFKADQLATHVLRGAIFGAGLALLFFLGAVAVSYIPVLAGPVERLLVNAQGPAVGLTLLVTLVNGVGEELFFRNTVVRHLRPRCGRWVYFAALGLYVAVTATMLVPLLAVAAIAVGALAHYEAHRTGALTSAIVMHAVWAVMLIGLMPIVL
ncbi:hypothetical protein GCM10028828_11290 [Corynebacterium tapiri]